MKREVVIAVSSGILIGLIFTYGIWIANQSLKQAGLKSNNKPKVVQASPTPPAEDKTNQNQVSSFVNSPEPNLLTNQKIITVSGTLLPNNHLIILTENNQFIIPSSNSTNFSQEITLEPGFNRIKFVSLDSQGKSSIIERLITYSTTTNLFDSATGTKLTPTATTGSSLRDSVKEKVEQQIAQIKNNLAKKAYLGTFAELSAKITLNIDTVIKLKNGSEGTSKDLKPEDTILAMGDADTTGNLTAKRILVIEPPKPDNRQYLIGTVKSFTNKTLTVENTVLNIAKDTQFVPSKYKFKDINPGFKLIAVYTTSITPLIHIVSEK